MDKELIAKAANSLSLQRILLGSHSVIVGDEFNPLVPIPKSSSVLNWGATSGMIVQMNEEAESKPPEMWLVNFRTRVRIVHTPESGTLTDDNVKDSLQSVLGDIKADFLAIYQVAQGDQIDEACMQEFATHNVPFHVWPYWREFLQSTAARTGLPIVHLKMYQVRGPRGKAKPGKPEDLKKITG